MEIHISKDEFNSIINNKELTINIKLKLLKTIKLLYNNKLIGIVVGNFIIDDNEKVIGKIKSLSV